ncbi:MAG: hypothetical protein ACP5JJ_12360 [Anaerolineae bacterium]
MIILLVVAALLFVAAVVSAVAYFVLLPQGGVAEGWQDPIAAVQPESVAADLALYPLAGALVVETVDSAMANHELETAYSVLTFGLDLSDAQRIGRLLLLGGQFAAADLPARAALCYQQVYELAILSPSLSDPARADALLASGKGWSIIGEEALALETYGQVHLIAAQSPYLQLANRRDLLVALEVAYRDLGDEVQASAIRAEVIALDQEGQHQPPSVAAERPQLPSLGAGSISTSEVGELEEARRLAAYDLLQALSATGDPGPDLVSGLAEALQAEDAAKVALYRETLEGTSQPGIRIDVHWHRIRWLMLKYQVASRGFGLSLLPEWEAQLPGVRSDLSKAYEDLYFDYEDLVTALPEARLIGPGSYQVRRQVILDGRLGRYVNYPAQQLVDKLQDVVEELLASGASDRLYVDAGTRGDGQLYFFLSPAEEYGSPVETP